MRGPNGVVVATAGAGAFAATPQCPHRQAKRRLRITYGLTGGISISSYSPIKSFWASDGKAPPHGSQTLGMWSRNSSGSSPSRRLCGSRPSFAPPGRAFSRFSFLSVEGGLLVRRRRLGRGARIPVGPLEPQRQIDQRLFAQALQIPAVHRAMDSDIAPRGKRWVIARSLLQFRYAPLKIVQFRRFNESLDEFRDIVRFAWRYFASPHCGEERRHRA